MKVSECFPYCIKDVKCVGPAVMYNNMLMDGCNACPSGDLYVHAELHGATSAVVKNPTGVFYLECNINICCLGNSQLSW